MHRPHDHTRQLGDPLPEPPFILLGCGVFAATILVIAVIAAILIFTPPSCGLLNAHARS